MVLVNYVNAEQLYLSRQYSLSRSIVSMMLLTVSFMTGVNSTIANDSFLQEPMKLSVDFENRNNNKSAWSLYFDNDALAGTDEDQGYSGGISISISGDNTLGFPLSLDPALGIINRSFGFGNENMPQQYSIESGLTVFTPDNTKVSYALPNELPYASLIYLSNNRSEVNSVKKTALTSSLTIGILGLKFTGKLQNLLHEKIGARVINGWGNQISSGGEPTFRYSIARQTILLSHYNNYLDYELTDTTKMNIGYLGDVLYGISFRAGKLNSPWWSFNPELEEYTEKSANAATKNKTHSSEFYLWGGINLRVRYYNAFLEGQFRDSAVTYNRSQLNNVIREMWVGVTAQFANGFKTSYFIRNQTPEIKQGPASRDLWWGGIIISRAFG